MNKDKKKELYSVSIIIYNDNERIKILKNIEKHFHGPNWGMYYGSKIILDETYQITVENSKQCYALNVFKLLCLYKDKEVKITKIV